MEYQFTRLMALPNRNGFESSDEHLVNSYICPWSAGEIGFSRAAALSLRDNILMSWLHLKDVNKEH